MATPRTIAGKAVSWLEVGSEGRKHTRGDPDRAAGGIGQASEAACRHCLLKVVRQSRCAGKPHPPAKRSHIPVAPERRTRTTATQATGGEQARGKVEGTENESKPGPKHVGGRREQGGVAGLGAERVSQEADSQGVLD